MIILDTNVVSAVMQPDINPIVVDWLNAQRSVDIWLTSVTLHEIRYGIEMMSMGQKRSGLEGRLGLILASDLGGRILNFDTDAVRYSAVVQAKAKRAVGHHDVPDCMIGGIAAAHGARVATRNISDFAHFGVPLIDPWAFVP